MLNIKYSLILLQSLKMLVSDFFKRIYRKFKYIINRFNVPVEKLIHLQHNNYQLQQLTYYKNLLQENFELLNQKRNDYNQLLTLPMNKLPLDINFYCQINKQMQQLDYDIQILTKLLDNVASENKINR